LPQEIFIKSSEDVFNHYLIITLILTSPSLSRLSLRRRAQIWKFICPFNRLMIYTENCIIMGLTVNNHKVDLAYIDVTKTIFFRYLLDGVQDT